MKILKFLTISNQLIASENPTKQTPFTTAVDWDNWGVTQSDNIEHIDLLKTTQASFYDEKWYEEWKKSFNEWQQDRFYPFITLYRAHFTISI